MKNIHRIVLGGLLGASIIGSTVVGFAAEKTQPSTMTGTDSVKILALDKVYSNLGIDPFEVKVWKQDDGKGTITYTTEVYSKAGKLESRTVDVTKYTVLPEAQQGRLRGDGA